MKSKKIVFGVVRISIFLAIFILVAGWINKTLLPKHATIPWNTTSKINGFYKQPKNTLDVVFIGSSQSFCTFNPYIFYKEARIKSYVFAANEQPLWTTYHYIKEVLKYQKPTIIVLEVLYISEGGEFKKEGVNRVNIDDLPFSQNKLAIMKASEEKLNFLNFFPIFSYHDRWKELKFNDFRKYTYGGLMGYSPLFGENKDGFSPIPLNIKAMPLPEKSAAYLQKIIKLCENEDIDLLFVKSPYNMNTSRLTHIETLKNIAKDKEIPFINFANDSLLSVINFNPLKDMDGGHTNIFGAKKVSTYVAQYLKSKYTFDKSRDFTPYIEMGKRLNALDTLSKIKKLNDYVDYLKDKDLKVFIAAKDEASGRLTHQLLPLGSIVNFKNKNRWSYIGIFNPQQHIANEKIDSLKLTVFKSQSISNPIRLKIESAGYDKGNMANIIINYSNKANSSKGRGLSFVVFDEVLVKVIDATWFDTHGHVNPDREVIYN